jgi:hypothetical protein
VADLKIGNIVRLKQNHAKWCLEHPEIYQLFDGTIAKDYEIETQLHLVACLGEPVYGIITGYGSFNSYLVELKSGEFQTTYYVGREHVVKIK